MWRHNTLIEKTPNMKARILFRTAIFSANSRSAEEPSVQLRRRHGTNKAWFSKQKSVIG